MSVPILPLPASTVATILSIRVRIDWTDSSNGIADCTISRKSLSSRALISPPLRMASGLLPRRIFRNFSPSTLSALKPSSESTGIDCR